MRSSQGFERPGLRGTRARGLLLATLLALGPRPAHAQLGAIDSWASGETALLAGLLGEAVAQSTSLADSVARLTQMVTALNDVLAAGRETVRIAKAVESLDPDRILQEVERGFFGAFPEARALGAEAFDLARNAEALGAGDGSYWDLTTAADYRVDRLAEQLFRYGFRGSARAVIGAFPPSEPTDLDLRLEKHFVRAGQSLKRAYASSVWNALATGLQDKRNIAERKKNLAAQIAGNNAASNLEAARSLRELEDLRKLEVEGVLAGEEAFEEWRAGTAKLLDGGESLGRIFAPVRMSR